jgi:hypothetical protein
MRSAARKAVEGLPRATLRTVAAPPGGPAVARVSMGGHVTGSHLAFVCGKRSSSALVKRGSWRRAFGHHARVSLIGSPYKPCQWKGLVAPL